MKREETFPDSIGIWLMIPLQPTMLRCRQRPGRLKLLRACSTLVLTTQSPT